MMINDAVLMNEEKAAFGLRALYQSYGYTPYKMSKFEEYELYVRNKDFLVSDHVITFTDTNGRLMALKPDVTLSIIKNGKDSGDVTQKVYYNENVYRVSKGSHSYKEIMQAGLECIGQIDDYQIFEVLMLACESLKMISDRFVLDISHLGIVSAIIERMQVTTAVRAELVKCIGEKNIHGIAALCANNGIDAAAADDLVALISAYGDSKATLAALCGRCVDTETKAAYEQLCTVVGALERAGYGNAVRIDFSVTGDMRYYNGIVFRGFIDGVPTGILSGGQYDNLMRKMGRKAGAIGFAVYLDLLERMDIENENRYDVDVVLLYDADTDIADLQSAVSALQAEGKSTMTQMQVPEKIRCKELLKLTKEGVQTIETNA